MGQELEDLIQLMRECVRDRDHVQLDPDEIGLLLDHIGKLQTQIDAVKYYESITETTP